MASLTSAAHLRARSRPWVEPYCQLEAGLTSDTNFSETCIEFMYSNMIGAPSAGTKAKRARVVAVQTPMTSVPVA